MSSTLDSYSFQTQNESDSSSKVISKEHCFYCFDALYQAIKDCKASSTGQGLEAHFDNPNLSFPLFVTWNTLPSQSKASPMVSTSAATPRLRGCIGTFEPQPLEEGLAEFAVISGLKDRRFSPITEKEFPRLQCVVSLLTNFEDCSDYLDWEVGIHGIYLHLPNPALAPSPSNSNSTSDSSSSSNSSGSSTPAKSVAKSKSFNSKSSSGPTFLTATYLPDVASAQGWSKLEAIDSAIRKAGYSGKITEEMRRGIRLRRYQSELIHVDWKEWKNWREERGLQVD